MALSVPIDIPAKSLSRPCSSISLSKTCPHRSGTATRDEDALRWLKYALLAQSSTRPYSRPMASGSVTAIASITYAERWADQYAAFLSGNDQKASGTPLEMLKPYGISDAQLSLCRALRVYSIESLHHLEGQNLKNLQMNANPLKDMARRYMADRASGANNADEMAKLRAQIEALQAQIPAKEPTPVRSRAGHPGC